MTHGCGCSPGLCAQTATPPSRLALELTYLRNFTAEAIAKRSIEGNAPR
jgi:hypothetical protein